MDRLLQHLTAMPRRVLKGAGAAGAILALALGMAATAAAVWASDRLADARVLTPDPDALAQDPHLLALAAHRGEPVYRRRCAGCHGDDARGSPQRSTPDLTDADHLYGSGTLREIEWIALHGVRAHDPRGWNLADMPAFATAHPYDRDKIAPLPPADIHDVVQYLLLLQDRPADPAAAKWGVQVFSGRGGCYDCHGSDARGDPAIGAPNLVDAVTLYGDGTAASLERSVAQGRRGVCPAQGRTLSPAAAREAAAYVYTLAARRAADAR